MARTRRSDWRQVVGAYRRSGLSQRAFALSKDMSVDTLRRWLRAAEDDPVGAPRLLAVRVASAAAAGSSASPITIKVGTIEIQIALGTDASYVAELVRALA